jgi:hypothetical protein
MIRQARGDQVQSGLSGQSRRKASSSLHVDCVGPNRRQQPVCESSVKVGSADA